MKFQDLLAYKISFALVMRVFEVAKTFPNKEYYSLTDQLRRYSRSVAINISEAYRKRSYPKYYISKLTGSDSENSETQGWLEFSFPSNYIDKSPFYELTKASEEVGRLIFYMINNPGKFEIK